MGGCIRRLHSTVALHGCICMFHSWLHPETDMWFYNTYEDSSFDLWFVRLQSITDIWFYNTYEESSYDYGLSGRIPKQVCGSIIRVGSLVMITVCPAAFSGFIREMTPYSTIHMKILVTTTCLPAYFGYISEPLPYSIICMTVWVRYYGTREFYSDGLVKYKVLCCCVCWASLFRENLAALEAVLKCTYWTLLLGQYISTCPNGSDCGIFLIDEVRWRVVVGCTEVHNFWLTSQFWEAKPATSTAQKSSLPDLSFFKEKVDEVWSLSNFNKYKLSRPVFIYIGFLFAWWPI